MPRRSSGSWPITLALPLPVIASAIAGSRTDFAKPYTSAVPYRKNADENDPRRKYLRLASCDSRRRRRARPHMRYSGSESTSSAMNIVSRSFAAGKSSIPPTENSSSGNTSDCTRPARRAWASAGEPGTAEACGVNGPPESTVRSASVSTATIARTRIVPCRKSAGPSTTTEPVPVPTPAVIPCRSRAARITTATSAPTRPTTVTATCVTNRSLRGTKASASTPTSAAANTMSIGEVSP